MVLVKKFCCCGLRTGAMILGWLGIISSIFYTVSVVTTLTSLHDQIPLNNPNVDAAQVRNVIRSFYSTTIGGGIVGILMNTLLIYGTYKNKKLFLLPWLVTIGGEIMFFLVVVIFGGIFFLSSDAVMVGVVIYLFGFPYTALLAYFWICILSLYQKFNDNEHGDNINLTNEPSSPVYDPTLPPYKSVV